MVNRTSFAVVIVLCAAASVQAANDELVQQLKQVGQAVDNMAVQISTAASDADATLMAQAIQQTFASQLGGSPKPEVSVTASAGHCDVLITTPLWKLWSRAEKGAIVDHGATIN